MMLLGSIGFMMGVFYLTNHSNKNFRMHAWQVISSTISIFSAVLLFQGFNGLVEEVFIERYGMSEISVAVCHFVVWYICLQAVLAILSGAVDPFWFLASAKKSKGTEPQTRRISDMDLTSSLLEDQVKHKTEMDEEEKQKRITEENMKCWATLMGHIVGFAAINMWCGLQHEFRDNVAICCGFPLLGHMGQKVLNTVAAAFRKHISEGDDGVVDEDEEAWGEETEETEDDVVGLAVSFLAVQAIRLMITGSIPNVEGEEEPELEHSWSQIIILDIVGYLFLIWQFAGMRLLRSMPRMAKQHQIITAFVFSWCIYFSADWFVRKMAPTLESGMMRQVSMALLVTVFAMSGIWLVEKLTSAKFTGRRAHRAARSIVVALATLIGFSWEKCFDIAVTSVADKTGSPAVAKVGMAIVLVAVVVPAWRWYILPDVLDMVEALEEEEDAEVAEDLAAKHGAAHGHDAESGHGGEDPRASIGSMVISTASGSGEKLRKAKRMSIIGLGPEKLRRRVIEAEQRLEEERLMQQSHKQRADEHEAHAKSLEEMLNEFTKEVREFKSIVNSELA
eukprot:TRINITY_DN17914_c0_g2_i1.p1 TRINITY_DN17914_c0_g2~~TRINITY_DN17914_c0_g2_i1.p1  ORF type:complete len:653 (-),score=138.46 TRINITY_DN17914_c0_g2_i1:167-1855(-)